MYFCKYHTYNTIVEVKMKVAFITMNQGILTLPGFSTMLRYMRGDYAESMRSLFTMVRWFQAASCQSLEAYSGMTPAKLF